MLINLTPHALNILNEQGDLIYIPRIEVETGRFLVLRADVKTTDYNPIEGFPVAINSYGEPVLGTIDEKGKDFKPCGLELLPATDYYIVSTLTLQACTSGIHSSFNGVQCIAPGEAIRNEAGVQIGAKGFSVL